MSSKQTRNYNILNFKIAKDNITGIGIGIGGVIHDEINGLYLSEKLLISSIVPDGPAEGKLKIGDEILEFERTNVVGYSRQKWEKLLRDSTVYSRGSGGNFSGKASVGSSYIDIKVKRVGRRKPSTNYLKSGNSYIGDGSDQSDEDHQNPDNRLTAITQSDIIYDETFTEETKIQSKSSNNNLGDNNNNHTSSIQKHWTNFKNSLPKIKFKLNCLNCRKRTDSETFTDTGNQIRTTYGYANSNCCSEDSFSYT